MSNERNIKFSITTLNALAYALTFCYGDYSAVGITAALFQTIESSINYLRNDDEFKEFNNSLKKETKNFDNRISKKARKESYGAIMTRNFCELINNTDFNKMNIYNENSVIPVLIKTNDDKQIPIELAKDYYDNILIKSLEFYPESLLNRDHMKETHEIFEKINKIEDKIEDLLSDKPEKKALNDSTKELS